MDFIALDKSVCVCGMVRVCVCTIVNVLVVIIQGEIWTPDFLYKTDVITTRLLEYVDVVVVVVVIKFYILCIVVMIIITI